MAAKRPPGVKQIYGIVKTMKALDTNLLVRILVHDNDVQAHSAFNYIQRHKEVFVGLIVLCKLTWKLEDY
ncbi:type II toxin-antitoxin system VapC family toxin [Coxiella endosymbiont of Ornithodoros amblus]|uniref:hypothetical protein n=1 Tax=Coxiella endosymbiont of Ornithodoros amblus TaxID=1656166 RepID=UPI00244E4A45|nr:hypothetical protein [Coxiella endosymbiont of Ornithodoros amblus]MBW5802745.1 type II toxin-antitoxin system VapC family toxin [Coxiella endosymbiont of Ornithodoros amblus]